MADHEDTLVFIKFTREELVNILRALAVLKIDIINYHQHAHQMPEEYGNELDDIQKLYKKIELSLHRDSE